MIDYEFGPPYEHTELDLCGKWDSSDSITIGFQIARDETGSQRHVNYSQRSRRLMSQVQNVFLLVSLDLKTVFEHPTAKEGHCPHITPSELYLEEPTEGIMLIEANHLREGAQEPMERCLAATAEIYGDLMFERARQ